MMKAPPFARSLFASGLALAASSGARAQCPELGPAQTYSGAGTVVCPCFVAGEQAGVYFPAAVIPASDYPIKLTKIGIGWGSQTGGAPPSVEDSINVYPGGTYPTPSGAPFVLGAPQLQDGFINEFDVSPNNIQLNTPGFFVTLKFFNTNDQSAVGPGFPSVVTDGSCTANRNVIYSSNPPPFNGWFNYCAPLFPGGNGDWLFYVKYEKVNCGGGGFTGTAYCFGDGTGSVACPCDPGQSGNPGEGCMHSFGFGGVMNATGTASVANDSVVLHATNLPPTTASLFFQGLNKTNGGNGQQFGDGLLCVTTSVIRLGTKTTSGGASDYGAGIGADQPVSIRGMIPAAGGTRRYQVWFRNAANFCTPSTFNLTNGLEIVWNP